MTPSLSTADGRKSYHESIRIRAAHIKANSPTPVRWVDCMTVAIDERLEQYRRRTPSHYKTLEARGVCPRKAPVGSLRPAGVNKPSGDACPGIVPIRPGASGVPHPGSRLIQTNEVTR